jgi:hypothetical protein
MVDGRKPRARSNVRGLPRTRDRALDPNYEKGYRDGMADAAHALAEAAVARAVELGAVDADEFADRLGGWIAAAEARRPGRRGS